MLSCSKVTGMTMVLRSLVLVLPGLMLIAGSASLAGCATSCNATEQKLNSLRRGMSAQEVAGIMGCSGAAVTEFGPTRADYSVVEWGGPGLTFTRTRMQFLNDRLESYSTEPRGAL